MLRGTRYVPLTTTSTKIINPTRFDLDLGMSCMVYDDIIPQCRNFREPVLIECAIHSFLPDYERDSYTVEVHEKNSGIIRYVKINNIQSVIKNFRG